MIKQFITAALIFILMSSTALAESIKIGFVTTLTTGAAIIGVDQTYRRQDGFSRC